jgi:hypothetical protein
MPILCFRSALAEIRDHTLAFVHVHVASLRGHISIKCLQGRRSEAIVHVLEVENKDALNLMIEF